jgi:hypothetical protein
MGISSLLGPDMFIEGHTQKISNVFSENRAVFLDNVEKCGWARQATDDYIKRRTLFCMFDNWFCKDTLRICNYYCFPTATMVGRTRRSVTLCVHCQCCLILMSICLCHLLLPAHNCMCISKNLRPLQSVISKRGLQFHLVITDVAGFTRSQHSYAVAGLRISAVSSKISAGGETKEKRICTGQYVDVTVISDL